MLLRGVLALSMTGACTEREQEPTDTGSTETGSEHCIVHETCDTLVPAFEAETESIRSCDADGECGQVLHGTSCGCTLDWVARKNADATCFYELIDQAGGLGCDLGLGSICPCPEADGFACEDGTCTWNYL
jgi:hypothetical protein